MVDDRAASLASASRVCCSSACTRAGRAHNPCGQDHATFVEASPGGVMHTSVHPPVMQASPVRHSWCAPEPREKPAP